jgi:hypothetical protein
MRLLLSLTLALFCSAAIWAQPKQNSPYSRYGIGDPMRQYFAHAAGYGGQSAAFHDPFHLNLVNPASYAHLRSTALEVGLFSKYSQYQSASASQNVWSGNLAYLALGFTLKSPINEVLDRQKSPWTYGMGFALTPYSLVGYNIQTQDTLPDLGAVANSFVGNGGSYRLTWSNAAKYKNTSVGANIGWMFGKTIYENTTIFTDSFQITYQDNFRDDIQLGGLVWAAGVQHDFVLQRFDDKTTPKRWITLGLNGEGKHKLRTVADIFRIRSRGRLSSGAYADADTLRQSVGVRQTLTLPAAFSLGLQYVNSAKFKVGAQIGLENWSEYRSEARPEAFRNTMSLSGGFEYIPDYISYNRFWKRVRYRAGFYYRQDPRSAAGQDLDDFGLTFGFGLPVTLPRQQTSFVNAAFELGKIGANSPIEETYIRMTLGFTLNDNTWFFKRRFE